MFGVYVSLIIVTKYPILAFQDINTISNTYMICSSLCEEGFHHCCLSIAVIEAVWVLSTNELKHKIPMYVRKDPYWGVLTKSICWHFISDMLHFCNNWDLSIWAKMPLYTSKWTYYFRWSQEIWWSEIRISPSFICSLLYLLHIQWDMGFDCALFDLFSNVFSFGACTLSVRKSTKGVNKYQHAISNMLFIAVYDLYKNCVERDLDEWEQGSCQER